MMELYHDSRDENYRQPFGARPAGVNVLLRLLADDVFTYACVRAWFEGREIRTEMTRRGSSFEAEIILPSKPGIYWYYFIARDIDGRSLLYGNAADSMGGIGQVSATEPPSYQITVYDPAYRTPDWMHESALYQIFPDRFSSSGRYDAARLRPDMRVHKSWDETPDMRMDGADCAADDLFGGDLPGITQKLDYIASLGVGCIYLNPIFKARSNHKYDTGCYMQVDPTFGTEKDLSELCREARKRGIRVILDGVFSHTGADSLYFDKYGHYGGHGAYSDPHSPYASWYTFRHWPDSYECWWDFENLPNVREEDPSYKNFILGGGDSVILHWPRAGTSGWRLDVADELPMDFLREMRTRLKGSHPDACMLGEVWEDASRKVAYQELRSYCLGDTLDSCMNYPVRDALIDFMLGKTDAFALERVLESQRENYSYPFLYSCMNLLGSHDKPRAISVLSGREDLDPPRESRCDYRPTEEEYEKGKRRYLASLGFLCSIPGMPSLYYGDEAGLTGMSDPFCRGTFPWGREDASLTQAVRSLLTQRPQVCRTGWYSVRAWSEDVITVFRWFSEGLDVFGNPGHGPEMAITVLNRAEKDADIDLVPGFENGFPFRRRAHLRVGPCRVVSEYIDG